MAEEKSVLFEKEGFGAAIRVIPAGSFTDENNKTISYSRGIKIQTGNRSIKINALQGLALKEIFSDPDFLASINAWALEEKRELENQMSMIKKL